MALGLLRERCDAMDRAKDSDELRVELEKFAKEMGFENFAYVLNVSAPTIQSRRVIISGFPKPWVDRYLSSGYFQIDPVIQHASKSTLPIVWDAETLQSGESAEFWEEARGVRLRAGLSFGIHEQPGITGIFSLAREEVLDLQGRDLAALIGFAQVFAALLHDAVGRLVLPELLPERSVTLTARERECLKWAAHGKTAWEIGQILGIAERTAVFHLCNVIRKLGATNKTQAIARAVALNLV